MSRYSIEEFPRRHAPRSSPGKAPVMAHFRFTKNANCRATMYGNSFTDQASDSHLTQHGLGQAVPRLQELADDGEVILAWHLKLQARVTLRAPRGGHLPVLPKELLTLRSSHRQHQVGPGFGDVEQR